MIQQSKLLILLASMTLFSTLSQADGLPTSVSSVLQFYVPIQANLPRPKNWPQKLTFYYPTENFQPEQISQMLIGTWTYVYHCDGAPLILSDLIATSPADGYVDPAIVLSLDGEEFYFSRTLPNTISGNGGLHSGSDRVNPLRGTYSIGLSDQEHYFRIHFYGARLFPAYVQPLYVKETKEWVFELYDKTIPYCPNGAKFKSLLVPVPLS